MYICIYVNYTYTYTHIYTSILPSTPPKLAPTDELFKRLLNALDACERAAAA